MTGKVIQLSDYINTIPNNRVVYKSKKCYNNTFTIWRKDRTKIQNFKRILFYITIVVVSKYKIQ